MGSANDYYRGCTWAFSDRSSAAPATASRLRTLSIQQFGRPGGTPNGRLSVGTRVPIAGSHGCKEASRSRPIVVFRKPAFKFAETIQHHIVIATGRNSYRNTKCSRWGCGQLMSATSLRTKSSNRGSHVGTICEVEETSTGGAEGVSNNLAVRAFACSDGLCT